MRRHVATFVAAALLLSSVAGPVAAGAGPRAADGGHRRRRDDGRVSRPGRPDRPLDRRLQGRHGRRVATRARHRPRRLPRRSHVHPRDPRLLGPADRRPGRRASPRLGGRRGRARRADRGRGPDQPRPGSAGSARASRRRPKIDGIDERVDADVAIVDTGIAKVPDLNVVGGYNCSTIDPTPLARRLRPRDARRRARSARSTTASGVVGVAPGVRLWAVKILDDTGCRPAVAGTSAGSTGSPPSATRTTRASR